MQNEPFIIENLYKISLENVWKAITCSTEMKQWYFDVPGFRAEPGFEFHFVSSSDEERSYRHQCQVTEVKPFKKLVFTWQYNHYDAVTLVTIELFPEPDGSTRLMLTHEGLEAYPDNDPDFSKESFAEGWTWLINCALKEYLEKTYKPAGKKLKMEVSL